MSIISDIYNLVNQGLGLSQAVEQIVPGADPGFWRKQLANYNPAQPASKKTARKSTPRPSRSKKSNYAKMQSALGRATLELVERVNGQADDRAEVRFVNGRLEVW